MMWKQFLATLASIIAAVTIGVGLAVVPRMDTLALPSPAASKAAPEDHPPAPLPRQAEAAPSEDASLPPSGYLLGEYNGRVSVLSPGTREPEMIFDIFVRTLPDPDQQLLRQGIEVETYEELTRLIEDYIS